MPDMTGLWSLEPDLTIFQVERPRIHPEVPPLADCAAPGCDSISSSLYATVKDTGSPIYRCSNGHFTEVMERSDSG